VHSPRYTFPHESDFLKGPLLGQVVNFGACLKSVGGGVVEQVLDQLTLSLGSDPSSPVIREKHNPYLVVPKAANRTPRNPSRAGPIFEDDRQIGQALADQPVFVPAPFDVLHIVHAETKPLELPRY
jgi:hypothetical protein